MTTDTDTTSISDVGWALATLYNELGQARYHRKRAQDDVEHWRLALEGATERLEEADRQIDQLIRAMSLLGFTESPEEAAA